MTFIFGFRKHCENVVFGLFERNLKKENNSEKKILWESDNCTKANMYQTDSL